MRYEGPIYRPPSEADSLLIQATVGCPHNKCTFCLVYKKGPKFRIRPAKEIIEDMYEARQTYGKNIRSVFFPAGNTIAMPTDSLAKICSQAKKIFPFLQRITVYGSAQYIWAKGEKDLKILAEAGLSRIHVGLESGDDTVLERIKKGSTRQQQIEAGQLLAKAGIENSTYIMLGIGGLDRSKEHALATASALNEIQPDFLRIRTFLPKINTLLLKQIEKGQFQVLSPHQILREAKLLLENLYANTRLYSDHYTNYINLEGKLPEDKTELLSQLDEALTWPEKCFRPFFIGTE